MVKNQTLAKPVSAIGEEIGFELGQQMVLDYQASNQNDVHFYTIGRDILDQILAQPTCAGIRFYNAYNEAGEKTLVYVGLDKAGKAIFEVTCINNEGVLETKQGHRLLTVSKPVAVTRSELLILTTGTSQLTNLS